jgi:hypothetical protein
VRRWGIVGVASVALTVGLTGGCSDDVADDDPPVGRPGSTADLAERLGCEETSERISVGYHVGGELRQCVIDGEWPANVHARLTPQQRAAEVRLLAMRSDYGIGSVVGPQARCPDGSVMDPVVVAGDTWIVVVSDEEGAERVMDRIGGEVQPAETSGPPISYEIPAGGFCRQ